MQTISATLMQTLLTLREFPHINRCDSVRPTSKNIDVSDASAMFAVATELALGSVRAVVEREVV